MHSASASKRPRKTSIPRSERMRPAATQTLGANRNFRLQFSASAVSNLGDRLSVMALP